MSEPTPFDRARIAHLIGQPLSEGWPTDEAIALCNDAEAHQLITWLQSDVERLQSQIDRKNATIKRILDRPSDAARARIAPRPRKGAA